MLSLKDIKGVGDATIKKLYELDVTDVFKLFSFLPSKYIDLQQPISIAEAYPGQLCLFEGRAEKVSAVSQRGKRSFYVSFSDNLSDNNKLRFKATFYNMPFLHDSFEIGQSYRMLARLSKDTSTFEIVNPQLEKADKISKLKGIYTLYPLKGVMGQNAFKNVMYAALDDLKKLEYTGRTAKINGDLAECFEVCHRPKDVESACKALERLAAIDMALALSIYRKSRDDSQKSRKVLYNLPKSIILDYKNALSFEPTESQQAAFCDILQDLNSPECMSRIINGDVGSGKTAVAFFAACCAASAGHQCAIIAPTEILARQHAEKFAQIARAFHINCAYLSGSTSSAERKNILSGLKSGEISCVIGTHALVSDDVEYKNLSLAVIDEQHRFGVNDRSKLEKKGACDILSLTATPIPRSLALTFYKDIAISAILKREGAKTDVKTRVISDVNAAVKHIVNECETQEKQAFIVCPAIKDAEGYEIYSVESFSKEFALIFENTEVAILHGKLSDEQKNNTMLDFASGKIKILIATSVIEVGVDTKASEMLILNADRFGLASLHQLRGRIGRDGREAHCYLHCANNDESSALRLDTLCKSNDGQYLAEVDFAMRGAGELIGVKQSGTSQTPVFGLRMNARILKNAKEYADNELVGFSLYELLALTRRSRTQAEEFMEIVNKVTLNS